MFLAVPEETDLCQWTEWTSCDFFCGTPRISRKTREKASEGSDGDCRKDLDTSVQIAKYVEEEDCDTDQECKCEYSSYMTEMANFFQLLSSLVPG